MPLLTTTAIKKKPSIFLRRRQAIVEENLIQIQERCGLSTPITLQQILNEAHYDVCEVLQASEPELFARLHGSLPLLLAIRIAKDKAESVETQLFREFFIDEGREASLRLISISITPWSVLVSRSLALLPSASLAALEPTMRGKQHQLVRIIFATKVRPKERYIIQLEANADLTLFLTLRSARPLMAIDLKEIPDVMTFFQAPKRVTTKKQHSFSRRRP